MIWKIKFPDFSRVFLINFGQIFWLFLENCVTSQTFKGLVTLSELFEVLNKIISEPGRATTGGWWACPPSPLHFLVNYGGRQYFSVFRGPFTLKSIPLALRTIQFKKHIAEKHSWPISGQCSPFIATEGIRKQVFCFQGELKRYTDLKWFNCIFSVIWIYHILKYI